MKRRIGHPGAEVFGVILQHLSHGLISHRALQMPNEIFGSL
jgi:hypothetical protein